MTTRISTRLVLALPFALAILSPTLARADQCGINSEAIADRAAELAKKSTLMLELCEPCGEKTAKGPYPIGTVDSAQGRVTFDGQPRDLAYTYILVGKDTYQNLGLLAGCSARRVTQEIVDARPPITRPTTTTPTQGLRRLPGAPPRPLVPHVRVSKPDDLAGTWKVTMRQTLDTCKNTNRNRNETWSITVGNGTDIVVNQGTGADDFIGTQPALVNGIYRPLLSTKHRPSANVLQLAQAVRDSFYGWVARAEPSGIKGDPACLTVMEISAKRAP
jgi:hypothetical protein